MSSGDNPPVLADRGPSAAQDIAAGVLLAGVGVGAIVIGQSYGVGSLRQMQPGFFPVALGVILCCIGLVMLVGALPRPGARRGGEKLTFDLPDWRGGICIVAGVFAFLVVGTFGGLLPAAFACVFTSAMGDRTASWRRALVLAFCVALAGSLFFSYVLQIEMPLLAWGRA
jgi:hypothetical protein